MRPARAPSLLAPARALAACVAVAGLAGLATPQPAAAEPVAPAPARATLDSARLAGAGALRWLGLRIYDARLWVGPDGIDPGRLDASPFALELGYARALSGAAIAERSAEEIERLGLGDAQARQAWHRRMQQLFPDVSDGDRILGLHRPGQAARFYLNGSPLGEVADPGFGPAFFAIWFDARTVAPDLRQALLGPAAPR
jgi:hypothetical protein